MKVPPWIEGPLFFNLLRLRNLAGRALSRSLLSTSARAHARRRYRVPIARVFLKLRADLSLSGLGLLTTYYFLNSHE